MALLRKFPPHIKLTFLTVNSRRPSRKMNAYTGTRGDGGTQSNKIWPHSSSFVVTKLPAVCSPSSVAIGSNWNGFPLSAEKVGKQMEIALKVETWPSLFEWPANNKSSLVIIYDDLCFALRFKPKIGQLLDRGDQTLLPFAVTFPEWWRQFEILSLFTFVSRPDDLFDGWGQFGD